MLLASIVASGTTLARPAAKTSVIEITAPASGAWVVRYRLPRPAVRLVFERSPDDSRAKTWAAPAGFAFGRDDNGEFLRRVDGARFQTVSFTLSPTYRELPKDYGPFAPFGDGGMLFHSGRFFACGDTCPDRGGRWSMTLRAPAGRILIADGRVAKGRTNWLDQDSGRYVYVGTAQPIIAGDTVAVIDRMLPEKIRSQIDADLPRFLQYYAAKLGQLPTRPELFVSYDLKHVEGWGRQGGVLPGQIFVHFYGKAWPAEMEKPAFGFDLAWHLAHESGHFYQRNITEPDKAGMWVHEGGAEAFAALAVGAENPEDDERLKTKIAVARSACGSATRERSLQAVIEAGDFNAPYTCGMILNLDIHNAILALDADSDGLFGVWRSSIADRNGNSGRFDRALRAVGGDCVADAVARATAMPGGVVGNGVAACTRHDP